MNDISPQKSIVIIGNGISGITLARHLRKNTSYSITIISDETPYFFSRTAMMYVYMGHMKFDHTQPYENNFWIKNDIQLVQKRVRRLIPNKKTLLFDDDTDINYDILVIACGSKPNRFGWPGQELNAVQGFYHKHDLEQLESWTPSIEEATVVGGGLIGVELAEMLHSRGKKVHFLIRESSFWNMVLPAEESEIVTQHIKNHGIDVRVDTELKSIDSDENGRAKGVYTSVGEYIPSNWVGLSVGVSPNIDFLKDSSLAIHKGILVNRYLETNLPFIYAIGDCAEQTEPLKGRRPVEAVWYTGRKMGETLAQTLSGSKTAYTPGLWFNSAKFFDIEYQTYGTVNSNPDKKTERHLFWSHPKKNMSLRISYDPNTLEILGSISLGLRLSHVHFEKWIREKKNMNNIVSELKSAFFDPEFSTSYEKEINMFWQLEKSKLIL